jgi:hypothetical protein
MQGALFMFMCWVSLSSPSSATILCVPGIANFPWPTMRDDVTIYSL